MIFACVRGCDDVTVCTAEIFVLKCFWVSESVLLMYLDMCTFKEQCVNEQVQLNSICNQGLSKLTRNKRNLS